MSDYMYQWLNQTWIIVTAVVAGVTLIWKFRATLKEMNEEIKKPITEINEKLSIMEDDNRLGKRALLCMQRNSLLRSCQEYIGKGFASAEEKITINEQYQSYHDLGGDSFITDMVDKVNSLPFDKK